MIWLLGLVLAQEPSDQTLVYWNARMALREGRPDETDDDLPVSPDPDLIDLDDESDDTLD